MGGLLTPSTLPIEVLVEPLDRVLVSVNGMPPNVTRLLSKIGLPLIDEAEFVPEPVPEPERGESGQRRSYRLAIFGNMDIVASLPSWRVVATQRERPNDVPVFVNASPDKFVKSAWRYFWIHRQLFGKPVYPETYDHLADFLSDVQHVDPAVGHDAANSLWPAIIEGW